MNFSKRMGYESSNILGLEEMPDTLRMAIWNQVHRLFQNCISSSSGIPIFDQNKKYFAEALWSNFFHKALNEMPAAHNKDRFLNIILEIFFALEWHKVYDLIDFILNLEKEQNNEPEIIANVFNEILKDHNAPYRICNNLVQPIATDQVIQPIECANKLAGNSAVQFHLNEAERCYSSRQPGSGKFIDACRHSVYALEAVLRLYFQNDKIISKNAKKLTMEQKIHPTLAECIEKMAGFRGDASGIGHAREPNKEEKQCPPPETLEDAILIHTLCCGFINFFMPKVKNRSEASIELIQENLN